jgi:methylglyoxal synthase
VGELPEIAQSDLAREITGVSRGRFEKLFYFRLPGVSKSLDFNVSDFVRLTQVVKIPSGRNP